MLLREKVFSEDIEEIERMLAFWEHFRHINQAMFCLKIKNENRVFVVIKINW